MASEETIREIKRRADLGAIVGRYVELKKSGRSLTGRCPFHQEKTPSFYVHPDEGYFKCFGCDAKGDVFTFLTRQTGQAFSDVLRGLAEETGVELDNRPETPAQVERRRQKKRILQVLQLSQTYHRNKLMSDEGKPARAYLARTRGLDKEAVDKFELGFGGMTDDGLIRHLKNEGVSEEEMVEAGVVKEGRHGLYDFFRRRVTFPIRGTRGDVLTFAGRAFGDLLGERAPKYVNGPATPVYDKSAVLYGLHESLPALKRGKPAVLVEGQLDVIAVHRAGLETAFAPCGTSLTERHVEELKRYTERVVLCLDADAAGQKATERAVLLFLKAGVEVSIATLLGNDPDDMVRDGQGDELKSSIEGAPAALDAMIETAVRESIDSARERVRAIDHLLPFLAAPPRDLVKRQYIRAAAKALEEDEAVLLDEVEQKGKEALAREQRAHRAQRGPAAPSNARGGSSNGPPMAPPPAGPEEYGGFEGATEYGGDPAPAPRGGNRSGAPAPSGAQWSAAEKVLAKALLLHPLLVPRADVLLDGLRNRELRTIIRELNDAVVRHHDKPPLEVLKQTRLPGGEVLKIVETIHKAGGFTDPARVLDEQEAAETIDDFLKKSDQRPVHERLREVQRAMNAAKDADDHDEWKRLEVLHRDLLDVLRKERASPALAAAPAVKELPPRAPATPRSLEGDAIPDAPRLEDPGTGQDPDDPGIDPDALAPAMPGFTPPANDDDGWDDDPAWDDDPV